MFISSTFQIQYMQLVGTVKTIQYPVKYPVHLMQSTYPNSSHLVLLVFKVETYRRRGVASTYSDVLAISILSSVSGCQSGIRFHSVEVSSPGFGALLSTNHFLTCFLKQCKLCRLLISSDGLFCMETDFHRKLELVFCILGFVVSTVRSSLMDNFLNRCIGTFRLITRHNCDMECYITSSSISSQLHISISVRLFALLPCPMTNCAALLIVTCNLSKYFLCVPP